MINIQRKMGPRKITMTVFADQEKDYEVSGVVQTEIGSLFGDVPVDWQSEKGDASYQIATRGEGKTVSGAYSYLMEIATRRFGGSDKKVTVKTLIERL